MTRPKPSCTLTPFAESSQTNDEWPPIYQRLRLVVETLEQDRKGVFGRKVGLKAHEVHGLINGRLGTPTSLLLLAILDAYPRLEPHWLIHGTGSMLVNGMPLPLTSQQRVSRLVVYFCNGNQRAFCRATGLSPATLNAMTGPGGQRPNRGSVGKMLRAFPQVNPLWLGKGQEPMLLESAAPKSAAPKSAAPESASPESEEGPISVEWRFCAEQRPVLASGWWVRHSQEYAAPVAGELVGGLFGEGPHRPVLRTVRVLRLSGQRTYVASTGPVEEPVADAPSIDEDLLLATGWLRMETGRRQLPAEGGQPG